MAANPQRSDERLFGAAALDRSSKARSTFLDACSNAAELSQLVEELFLADKRAGSFLEGRATRSAPTLPTSLLC
jgi:hypothetical protein